jgi:hypothetical protein
MKRGKRIELPPGITRRQYDEWLDSQARLSGAHGKAFPGPIGAALAPETTMVMGFALQPVSSVHLVALQRCNSPLLRAIAMLRQHAGKPAKEIKKIAERMEGGSSEEMIEMFYIFTRTPDELCELLSAGPAWLRAEALRVVGVKVPAPDVPKLAFAAGAHFAAAYATVVSYEQEKADGSFPSAPARRATASAGASI